MQRRVWWGVLAGLCWGAMACSEPGAEPPGPPQVGVRAQALEDVCSQDWCWNAPSPQGNDLNALWAIAANDAWAVGDFGTLIHWNGTGWSGAFGVTAAHLHGVWASGPNDVWAVGELGTILHWTGSSWAQVPSGVDFTLLSVWGSGANDVWAVGQRGALLHWTGAAWSQVVPFPPSAGQNLANHVFEAVSGTAANDVWVASRYAGVLRWDGTQWSWAGQLQSVVALSAQVPGEVWAMDVYGGLFRWSGMAWVQVTGTGAWSYDRVGFLVRSATEVWVTSAPAGLRRWDGTAWSAVASPPATAGLAFHALSAASTGPVWAAGSRGLVLAWDGTTWSGDGDRPSAQLNGIWGTTVSDAGVVWSVGSQDYLGVVQRWDGSRWTRTTLAQAPLRAIWGSSANDVWAVGDSATLLHFDGSAWSARLTPFSRTSTAFTNVWGSGPGDVWFVGLNRTAFPYDNLNGFQERGVILHWDGTGFESYESDAELHLNGVWGSGPNDVWAVGGNYAHGLIVHWDGTAWTKVPAPDVHLDAVRGTSATDVWAVGMYGTTLHWDGTAWTEVHNPLSNTLRYFDDVWAFAPNDVWVAGGGNVPWVNQGTLLHWDGTSWTLAVDGAMPFLTSVWGSRPTDVWAMGQWGTVLHKAR